MYVIVEYGCECVCVCVCVCVCIYIYILYIYIYIYIHNKIYRCIYISNYKYIYIYIIIHIYVPPFYPHENDGFSTSSPPVGTSLNFRPKDGDRSPGQR